MYKIKIGKILAVMFLIGIIFGFSRESINESKASVEIVHEEVEIEWHNGVER
jgi:hypothetical protein